MTPGLKQRRDKLIKERNLLTEFWNLSKENLLAIQDYTVCAQHIITHCDHVPRDSETIKRIRADMPPGMREYAENMFSAANSYMSLLHMQIREQSERHKELTQLIEAYNLIIELEDRKHGTNRTSSQAKPAVPGNLHS